uniref:Innexin n=1 Tax=Panagrolaimus sp. PS1159 TaxID=55785 RepID=A0AC35FIF1_9BILA
MTFCRPKYDDDRYDRYNYAFTTNILTIALILICLKQTVGTPIHCWIPAEFDSSWEGYIERYCFIENTYYVNATDTIMPPLVKGANYELRYYQWVSVFLFVQIVLFMMPRNFWSFASERTGLDLYSIYGSLPPDFGKQSELSKRFESIGNNIHELLDFESKVQGRFCYIIPRTSYLTFVYLFYKFLQCANVAFQVYMMNHYLNTTYSFWGYGVFHDLIFNRNWKASGRFPRETICNFIRRDETSSAPIQFPVQCVLMINMFNELLCIAIWVWLTVLACINIYGLIYWSITAFSGQYHNKIVKNFLEYAKVTGAKKLEFSTLGSSDVYFTNGDVNDFIRTRLFKDGITTIRLISKNVGNYDASGIVHAMFEAYKKGEQEEVEESKDDTFAKEIIYALDEEIQFISDAIKNDEPLSAFLGTYLNYGNEQFEYEMNQIGEGIKYEGKSKKVKPNAKNPDNHILIPVDHAKNIADSNKSNNFNDIRTDEIDTTKLEDENGKIEDNKAGQPPPPYFPPYYLSKRSGVHPRPLEFADNDYGDYDTQNGRRTYIPGLPSCIHDCNGIPQPFNIIPSERTAQYAENSLPSYSEISRDIITPINIHSNSSNSLLRRQKRENISDAKISSSQNVRKVDQIKKATKLLRENFFKSITDKTSDIQSAPVSSEIQPLNAIVVPEPESAFKKAVTLLLNDHTFNSLAETSLQKEKEPSTNQRNDTLENDKKGDEVTKLKFPDDKKAELIPLAPDNPASKPDMENKVVKAAEENIKSTNSDINVTSDVSESYYSAEETVKDENENIPELIDHEPIPDYNDPANVVIESSSLNKNPSILPQFNVAEKNGAESKFLEEKSDGHPVEHSQNLKDPFSIKDDDTIDYQTDQSTIHVKSLDVDEEIIAKEIGESTCKIDTKFEKDVIEKCETVEPKSNDQFSTPEESEIPQNCGNSCSTDELIYQTYQPLIHESTTSYGGVMKDGIEDVEIKQKNSIIPFSNAFKDDNKAEKEEDANKFKDVESSDKTLFENGDKEKEMEEKFKAVDQKCDDEPQVSYFKILNFGKNDGNIDEFICQSSDEPHTHEPTKSVDVMKVSDDEIVNDKNIPEKEENATDVKDDKSVDTTMFEDEKSEKNVREKFGHVESGNGKLPSPEESIHSQDFENSSNDDQPPTHESETSVNDGIEANEFKDDSKPEKEKTNDVKDVIRDEKALFENVEDEKDAEKKCETVEQKSDNELPAPEEPKLSKVFEDSDNNDSDGSIYQIDRLLVLETKTSMDIVIKDDIKELDEPAFTDDSKPEQEEDANKFKDAEICDTTIFENGEKDESVGEVPDICDLHEDFPIEVYGNIEKTENVIQNVVSDDVLFLPPQINENVIDINVQENAEPDNSEIESDNEHVNFKHVENIDKNEEGDVIDHSEKPFADDLVESIPEESIIPEPQKGMENIMCDSAKASEMLMIVNKFDSDECLDGEMHGLLLENDEAFFQEPAVHDDESLKSALIEEHHDMDNNPLKKADEYEFSANLPSSVENKVGLENAFECVQHTFAPNSVKENPETVFILNDELNGIPPVDSEVKPSLYDEKCLIPPMEAADEDIPFICHQNSSYPENTNGIAFNDMLLFSGNEEEYNSKKDEEIVEFSNVDDFIPSSEVAAEDDTVSIFREKPISQVSDETNQNAFLIDAETKNNGEILKLAKDEDMIPIVEVNQDSDNLISFDPVIEQVVEDLVDHFTTDWIVPDHLIKDESEVKETNFADNKKENDEFGH